MQEQFLRKGVVVKTKYRPMSSYSTGGHVCAPIWARFMKAAVPIQRTSKMPILEPAEFTSPVVGSAAFVRETTPKRTVSVTEEIGELVTGERAEAATPAKPAFA
jgi:cytochrome c